MDPQSHLSSSLLPITITFNHHLSGPRSVTYLDQSLDAFAVPVELMRCLGLLPVCIGYSCLILASVTWSGSSSPECRNARLPICRLVLHYSGMTFHPHELPRECHKALLQPLLSAALLPWMPMWARTQEIPVFCAFCIAMKHRFYIYHVVSLPRLMQDTFFCLTVQRIAL